MSKIKEKILGQYKAITLLLTVIIMILSGFLVFQMTRLFHLKHQPMAHKQYTIKKKSIPVLQRTAEYKFDIYPGDTVEKVAKRLEEKEIIMADAFLTYLKQDEIKLHSASYKKQERRYILEGYFLPGSYDLYAETSPEEICDIFLEPYLAWVEDVGNEQTLIVASLVEKEAATEKDRHMISGVIYNRLEQEMKLQIDATVLYALGYHKAMVTFEDLKTNSPYNTYQVKGLPPGPICTPSFPSLQAALDPEDHPYFFYVVEAYGQKHHVFATTYEEHLKNVDKYKQSKKN